MRQFQTDSKKMAFESLNVRLTRSNASISWGFELQQRGGDVIVSKVCFYYGKTHKLRKRGNFNFFSKIPHFLA
jgi:hypothetical protein